MTLGISSWQIKNYHINTNIYEGPLDLLLRLIEHSELDITKLALVKVTDQFLEHISSLQINSSEEVSAFLIIATKLIQIKSEVILPRPVLREEGEEDPGEMLAKQLIEYKLFKMSSVFFLEREKLGIHTYIRSSSPPYIEGTSDVGYIDIKVLYELASKVLIQKAEKLSLDNVVSIPKVTIRDKIRLISLNLLKNGRTSFYSLISASSSVLDLVVTFLAILELIKQQLVQVQQEELFGDVIVLPNMEFTEQDIKELEFGE